MSLAVVYSRASSGIKALLVTVETHISNGLPGLSIVGLPETCVKESKDRVRSALINSNFEFPAKRITINLAPADLPKASSRFDLPIALSILAASEQIPLEKFREYEFGGELALSGELRAIHGVLPFALGTRNADRALIIPEENAKEAALPGDNLVYAAKHLLDVFKHFSEKKQLQPYISSPLSTASLLSYELDLVDVQGQLHAKRALEIAAAGGHSMLMIGPPGTGKSMLASRLPSILPPLSIEEVLEVMAIYSLIPTIEKLDWGRRPFRNPHHSASSVALVGGGTIPRPGEISLAHHGILFLDELPEFARQVLEVLREPLETGSISISRAARKTDFPAQFQLIAAMNPCPCGYAGDLKNQCSCTAEQIKRYQNRLSGPLLDRIDMHIEVTRLSDATLANDSLYNNNHKADPFSENRDSIRTQVVNAHPISENSERIRTRVINAHQKQKDRCNKPNARLNAKELQNHCALDANSTKLMRRAVEKLGLSARSYHRILRVARTIADLAECSMITKDHLAEALSYRKLDRN